LCSPERACDPQAELELGAPSALIIRWRRT